MDQQIHISCLGLVRNVVGCPEESIKAAPGTTIGDLLQLSAAKQGGPSQQSVFRNSSALHAKFKVADLDDHRFVDEMARSGFFDKL